uniref:NADH dehydrogenase subunit 5 n=1 Tax=Rhagonycha nigroimpressa TaxID=3027144 RepID=UPI0023D80C02|nr:NADH dehydrogenase subunit 5 [Rhagonycha nigroimpressa]WCS40141.1 NADH dehydrogenase subunit 5 [Rhagonycha nigroimpressa]WRO44852.1 NADH dehydrogenase subunit 5 [Rhagonycha nigroimpressa]
MLWYGYIFMFMLINFTLSMLFYLNDFSLFIEYEVFSLNSSIVCMSILLDWMSLLFMSFVLLISSMVIYYSYEYMLGDLNLNRFITLVVMFVISMMFLIISPNLISILLGWDGLGLISYCLVIYYQNIKSFNAGMLTALSNRIGDVALLMSIAWMMNYGSWNFIYYLDFKSNDYYMNLIMMFVILAGMTKSAQIPFSSWLPAAMAAPTPVSSLVHSSTLVTAGVYLLIRFNYSMNYYMLMFLLFVSLLTMFMAGLGANFEYDLKKIVALSTLSQLGLMISVLSLGDYILAYYHLLMHALFKALLFMCMGMIIHNLGGCQDIRFMGGLSMQMPLTCLFLNISNLSLCGLPFLTGFYSKDLILEFMSMTYLNLFVYFVFYFSIGLTVSYSYRLTKYVLMSKNNLMVYMNIMEGKIMLKGMMGLIFFVIFGGSMMNWMMFDSLYFICIPLVMKFMVLIYIFMGILIGNYLSSFFNYIYIFMNKSLYFYMFVSGMWNLPVISTLGLNFKFLNMGLEYKKFIDQGWLEFAGSQNIYFNFKNMSMNFQSFLISNIKIYMFIFLVWIIYIQMI